MASRRGQSAVEYLLTNGWALLVLAIVLVVLYGLGIFNPNRYASEECTFQPGFGCQSALLTRDSTTAPYKLVLNLYNGLGYDMKIVGIDVQDKGVVGQWCTVSCISGAFSSCKSLGQVSDYTSPMLKSGQNCSLVIRTMNGITPSRFPSVGATEDFKVTITYQNCNTNPNYIGTSQTCTVSQTVQHVISGKITSRVEAG